ncbi:hypothetical protein M413DRAFT_443148 [Hebeloma cylindrosporum]|uniref:Uncharacterized protein n=1 Tax=Hebeloma cylindrosporum TaxID=76867 RepID=A0A0C3CK47_HEBCY|nr:hypothetical protein M413DRAFT_443148 [Hebeloma cylindrosporum h7]
MKLKVHKPVQATGLITRTPFLQHNERLRTDNLVDRKRNTNTSGRGVERETQLLEPPAYMRLLAP